MPDLSIIIVNYNGAHFIKECLDSVFASKTRFSFDVALVDNASKDNSLEILDPYKNKIQIIANLENKGFSAANNQGIRATKGRYVFLLNNDTVLKPDTLETLLDYYEKNPELGALAPRLLNADGSIQYSGSVLGHWQYRSEKPRKVSFLSGAAFLSSREIMDQVGGLDENFFFYNEDVDLCKMILKLGKPLVYLPQAQLIHYGGLSTATRKAASVIEGYRGGLYLCKKHYPGWVYLLYKGLVAIDVAVRYVVARGELRQAYAKIAKLLLVFLLISSSLMAKVYDIPADLLQEGRALKKIYVASPNAEATFELAMNYAYTGRIEKGWELLKKVPPPYADVVIKKYGGPSTEWKTHFKLAFGYYFKEQKKEALQEFQKVLKIEPKQIWAMGFIALVLGDLGHTDEAISWCKKALAIEKNATAIHFLLAEAQRRKGNIMAALGELMIVGRLKSEEAIVRDKED